MRFFFISFILVFTNLRGNTQSLEVNNYFRDIRTYGKTPIDFIDSVFRSHDLLIFDDALHNAYEPFVFYQSLINSTNLSGKIDYIFLEAISTTAQPLIDSFLRSKTKDSTILIREFQNDYSGMGWNLQTYMDLFNAVWDYNEKHRSGKPIRLVGVTPPVWWEAIHSEKDYELFQNSLKARDYFMYLEIMQTMNGFKANKKAIFLTNTRHAYKQIRNREGNFHWNTNTFFDQWNSGKAYSVRIHNVTLCIEAPRTLASTERKTTDGLSSYVYKWSMMDNGRWDSAFAANGNKTVMVPFAGTNFGKTNYVGNLMLNVAQGTTMADAYDALLFLAPLTNLHFSARFDFIYTDSFRQELERRLHIVKGPGFDAFIKASGAKSFDDYYKQTFKKQPISKNEMLIQ